MADDVCTDLCVEFRKPKCATYHAFTGMVQAYCPECVTAKTAAYLNKTLKTRLRAAKKIKITEFDADDETLLELLSGFGRIGAIKLVGIKGIDLTLSIPDVDVWRSISMSFYKGMVKSSDKVVLELARVVRESKSLKKLRVELLDEVSSSSAQILAEACCQNTRLTSLNLNIPHREGVLGIAMVSRSSIPRLVLGAKIRLMGLASCNIVSLSLSGVDIGMTMLSTLLYTVKDNTVMQKLEVARALRVDETFRGYSHIIDIIKSRASAMRDLCIIPTLTVQKHPSKIYARILDALHDHPHRIEKLVLFLAASHPDSPSIDISAHFAKVCKVNGIMSHLVFSHPYVFPGVTLSENEMQRQYRRGMWPEIAPSLWKHRIPPSFVALTRSTRYMFMALASGTGLAGETAARITQYALASDNVLSDARAQTACELILSSLRKYMSRKKKDNSREISRRKFSTVLQDFLAISAYEQMKSVYPLECTEISLRKFLNFLSIMCSITTRTLVLRAIYYKESCPHLEWFIRENTTQKTRITDFLKPASKQRKHFSNV